MTDTADLKIVKLDEADPAAIYTHYDMQYEAQPCYLSLDIRDGGLTCYASGIIGSGMPMSVFHNLVLDFEIGHLTTKSANALMEFVAPIAREILEGASVEWDGSNDVGRFTQAAHDAQRRMAEACKDWDGEEVVEYNADDWFVPEGREAVFESLGLTADTTDEQLDKMAADEERDAPTVANDGYAILTGARDWLAREREDMRDAERDRLRQDCLTLAELVDRRRVDILRLTSWGDSTRTIGAITGLSHPRVNQIVNEAARVTASGAANADR